MLIDAHQPEETRVVLLNGNKIEEFDYESTSHKQLKGNVYLAKVTRVEPSLQAAFVEYGGNRQGFLAFSEIHPDYYRIPVEDRAELVEAETADAEAQKDSQEADESAADETAEAQTSDDNVADENQAGSAAPETLGGEDETEERRTSQATMRRYKIQEVITRKQLLLVQVVKEERGNKGAALTTYLSLAGRYCVLMPNSPRGGGVSRKITNVADRKRLKSVVGDLEIPKGMAVIVRTAGAKRTKTEIKRDYAYLTKLWNEIRGLTIESEAPALIHEEGSLVKRTIRDVYSHDVEEVVVEGDDAYKMARAQMKMLIPSHVKRVVKYEGNAHLFQSHQVESQLDIIHQNEVTLKSGGYLVLNQTEALVAIDVNSGKATKERNIEETALKTNLEAADEVGRQLRLRDLSGLIVIDFIDMEENRNQAQVERRLKEALRTDRARIQVGSISHFGLLEMSRQRLRPSLVESISQTCPHCEGTGRVRSPNTATLQVLRMLEDGLAHHQNQRGGEGSLRGQQLTLQVTQEVALYMLNHKRETLQALEEQYGCRILVEVDNQLAAVECQLIGENGPIDLNNQQQERRNNNRRSRRQNGRDQRNRDQKNNDPKNSDQKNSERDNGAQSAVETGTDEGADDETSQQAAPGDDTDDEGQPKKRRRGRRGGRRRKKRQGDDGADNGLTEAQASEAKDDDQAPAQDKGADASAASNDQPEKPKKAARTTRKKAPVVKSAETSISEGDEKPADAGDGGADTEDKPAKKAKKAAKKTAKKAAKKAKKASAKKKAASGDGEAIAKSAPTKAPAIEAKPESKADTASEAEDRAPKSSAAIDVVDVDTSADKPKKRGWWSR